MEIPAARGGPFGMSRSTPQVARASGGRTLLLARSDKILAWDARRPPGAAEAARVLEARARPRPPAGRPARRRDGPGSLRGRGARCQPPAGLPVRLARLAAGPAGDRLYLLDFGGGVHALALDRDGTARPVWSHPAHARHPGGFPRRPDPGDPRPPGDHPARRDQGDRAPSARAPSDSPEGAGRPLALAFSPDGRELAVGTPQGQVEIWSLADPPRPRSGSPATAGPSGVLAYDATADRLASGGDDRLVEVWDLERLRIELGRLGLAWGADARPE